MLYILPLLSFNHIPCEKPKHLSGLLLFINILHSSQDQMIKICSKHTRHFKKITRNCCVMTINKSQLFYITETNSMSRKVRTDLTFSLMSN